ncbi:MAG: 1,4-alpha-glucan branching protein GlgB [Chlamydiota bacterium]|nr:1,4-alpha-glucan branching protein GlgB [Chlamydiota bacterium]
MGRKFPSNLQKETCPNSLFTEDDIYLFRAGKHFRLYEKLGAHLITKDEVKGVHFAVWAPNAKSVSVVGDFNDWNEGTNELFPRWDSSGIWEGFIPDVTHGALYKYYITSNVAEQVYEKTDPFAFYWEQPPKTASVVWDIDYVWNEKKWIEQRSTMNSLESPFSIYEMHIGSWKRELSEDKSPFSYKKLAQVLPNYLSKMGYTHVEFLPIMEHPFDGSWGYQTLGYFAPTSRFGTPQEFMQLVEALHDEGIGVILDWVPSHFPEDKHGIGLFDGTHLYEHEDPKKGFHPDWKSYIFNYGRNEVVSFLVSSALFWLDKYHVDGIRVDAVASMLYLDYSRKEGEWIPNQYGGNENLEAMEFIKQLNCAIYENYSYAQTMAEESTAWPLVSRPTYLGGLGFGMKWNMGWMHDTLMYFSKESVHRKYHHWDILFSMVYAYNENFILPLSHDEVVHGKASLLGKMPGDEWQKFANLRLLYGYMFAHPGKKLLFMGAELALWDEWNHDQSLPWNLLEYDKHNQIQRWVHDLNHAYTSEPALFETDFDSEGFQWIDIHDQNNCIISFLRSNKDNSRFVVCICNFTPVPRENYKVGVPLKGAWKELINSDSHYYGGSDLGNMGEKQTIPLEIHGFNQCLSLTLPPLSIVFLTPMCNTNPNK